MTRLSILLASVLLVHAALPADASAEPVLLQKFDASASAPSCGGDRDIQDVSLIDVPAGHGVASLEDSTADGPEQMAGLIPICEVTSGDEHVCRAGASRAAESTAAKRLLACWAKPRAEG